MDLFLEKRKYALDANRPVITYTCPDSKIKYRIIHLLPKNSKNHHLLVGPIDESDANKISFRSMVIMNKLATTHLLAKYNTEAILVIGKPSVQGQVALEKHTERFNIEFIDPTTYHFDRTKSLHVPVYRVLNKTQTTALLQRLHVTKKQLSHILRTDPIVRMYGFRHGQVLELIDENIFRVVI